MKLNNIENKYIDEYINVIVKTYAFNFFCVTMMLKYFKVQRFKKIKTAVQWSDNQIVFIKRKLFKNKIRTIFSYNVEK